jgi:post-segregation antitoxin (ccd killing protein)
MSNKKTVPRNFLPWPENEERLEFAKKIGLNVSEVINESLAKALKATIDTKAKKVREALAAPCP